MSNPLSDLIARAEVSATSPTTKQANKRLLSDLCVALVAQAQRIAMLEADNARPADPPHILTP